MECPVCGLINPAHTTRCDCGYDFDKKTGGKRRRSLGLSVVLSLWFAWLLVTTGDFATLGNAAYADVWKYFPHAVFNLFTPILFWNFSVKGVVLLLAGLLVGDLVGRMIRFKSIRVGYNLLCLFSLTAAIDVINWGSPKSIEDIKQAYNCITVRPRPSWCPVTQP